MASALGGLMAEYGDSDEEQEKVEGTLAETGEGIVHLPHPPLSSAPPVSPAQPPGSLGLTPPMPPTDVPGPSDGLGSADILAAMQQQQRLDQQAGGQFPSAMGLTGSAAAGVPLSPGLAADAGASPAQGTAGEGAAVKPPEPEPDLSLPAELPPPPSKPCAPHLQALITKLLETQKSQGQTLNNALKNHRDYRNPNFLQKMVEFCDISQYGSQYPKELWDPEALPPEDRSDALMQEHARWQERRQAERSKRGTVEFTAAATAAARTVAAVGARQVDARVLTQAAARTSAMLSSQGSSKRSKWDHASR